MSAQRPATRTSPAVTESSGLSARPERATRATSSESRTPAEPEPKRPKRSATKKKQSAEEPPPAAQTNPVQPTTAVVPHTAEDHPLLESNTLNDNNTFAVLAPGSGPAPAAAQPTAQTTSSPPPEPVPANALVPAPAGQLVDQGQPRQGTALSDSPDLFALPASAEGVVETDDSEVITDMSLLCLSRSGFASIDPAPQFASTVEDAIMHIISNLPPARHATGALHSRVRVSAQRTSFAAGQGR